MSNAAVVMYDDLNADEKELLSDIEFFSRIKEYCFTSNKYLVKRYGVSTRTVQRRFEKLKSKNYIIFDLARNKNNQRQVRLNPNLKLISFNMSPLNSEYVTTCVTTCSSENIAIKTNARAIKKTKKTPKLFKIYKSKDLYITSVFPTEKHITREHARTSETKNYIAKKFDDKKRTPEGVLKVVEKNKLSLRHISTLEAQGARIHATKGYIFNAPKSIDAKRVSEDTLSTVESIIKVLNQCASRHYKSDTQETLGFIIPLLEQGYKFLDFVKVITTKCRDWLGTPFAKYLRPKTLFRADNFAKYSNQHDQNSRGNWTCNQKVIQPRQNKFANFKQREWDFEKIEFLSQYDSASKEDLRRFEERRQARKAIERPKVENSRQNKFQNFAKRKWDFAKIKYLNQLRDDEPYTEEGMAEYRKYYEAQKAEREKREAENPRSTRFHNFEQRKWDFALIEKLAQED